MDKNKFANDILSVMAELKSENKLMPQSITAYWGEVGAMLEQYGYAQKEDFAKQCKQIIIKVMKKYFFNGEKSIIKAFVGSPTMDFVNLQSDILVSIYEHFGLEW